MYCSSVCTNASTMPLLTCRAGSEKVVSGSSTEKRGYISGFPNASFSLVAHLVTTEKEFISDPVAGSVSTHPSGIPDFTGAPLLTMSHGSPANGAATAMNFVPSSVDPPPTASRKSMFPARTFSTARIRVS